MEINVENLVSKIEHKNGDWTYSGQVSIDKQNPTGFGQLFNRKTNQIDEGNFHVYGKIIYLHGYGRKIWTDRYYEGNFVNGNFHGRGRMVYVDEDGGRVEEGLWNN